MLKNQIVMNALFPPSIRHVAVIAPAGPAPAETLQKNVAALEHHGLAVTIMPHVCSGAVETHLAGTVASRVADLHACWRNHAVDLVMCTRGGCGSAQLLPELDWRLLRSRSLPLIGYSDITALHLAMLKYGVGTPIAAPMAVKWCEAMEESDNRDYTGKYLRAALASEELATPVLPPSDASSLAVLKSGRATALPVVANLTVLASLCGTGYLPDFADRILLLEDVNEPPYKVDRCLTQLSQNGILCRCAGLLFGNFVGCGTEAELAIIFSKYADEINGPVIGGFPFGHSWPLVSINMTKPMSINNTEIIV